MRTRRQRKQSRGRIVALLTITVVFVLLVGGWYWRGHRRSHWPSERQETSAQKASKKQAETKPKKAAPKQSRCSELKRPNNVDYQQQLEAKLNDNQFVGTGLMVKDGKVVAVYGRGYANAQRGQVNGADTAFQINSMQKCLTEFLVMKQVQAGKVKLSDHLSQYYPQVPGSTRITLAQMFTMTSGLSMNGMGSGPYNSDRDVVNNAIAHLQFTPSAWGQANYQPVNVVLLAGILEKVSGQTYQQLFEEQLIRPLQLQHTYFGYQIPAASLVATGYYSAGNLPSYEQPLALSPLQQHYELGTGQVFMSAEDFYRAVSSILNGKLLPAALIAEQFKGNSRDQYGGGLYNTEPFKSANGVGIYFRSTIHITPNGQDGVVLMTNQSVSLNLIAGMAKDLQQSLL